jgi:hypothetical protein
MNTKRCIVDVARCRARAAAQVAEGRSASFAYTRRLFTFPTRDQSTRARRQAGLTGAVGQGGHPPRLLIQVLRQRRALAALFCSKPVPPCLGLVGPLSPFDAPGGRLGQKSELRPLERRQATRDNALGVIDECLGRRKEMPNSSGIVIGRCCQPSAVWTVHSPADRLVVPPENGDDISAYGIPNSRRFVVGGCCNPPSVRGERHLSNDLFVPSELPDQFSRMRIPHSGLQIKRARQNALSIGAECGA